MNQDQASPRSNSGHEPNVISVRAVAWSVLGLVGLIVVSFVFVAGLWRFWAGPAEARRTAAAEGPDAWIAPDVPQLDPDQTLELQRLRALERQVLTEYSWIDRQAGVARIPIDRAIEIITERGLPPVVGGSSPAAVETSNE